MSSRWHLVAALGMAPGAATGCGDTRDSANLDVAMAVLGQLLDATPPSGRTPGTNQAIAELVRDRFVEVGVTDVTIEEFSIPVSASTDHALAFSGAPEIAGAHDHQVNVFGGNGAVTGIGLVDVGVSAEPVPEAAGKVALLDFSVTRSLRTQYRNVIASGAVAAIIDSKVDALRQRNVWVLAGADEIDGPIPIVTIEQAGAAGLREQLELGVDVRVDLATDAAVDPQRAYNVIARIPGTTYPDRTLVVNAHLDSWFAGAADDGQAVGALVALAKTFTEQPLPYTLELVAFDCEETFLLGSNDYLRRRLPGVRDTVIGAISLEMLAPKNRELSFVTIDPKEIWLPAIEAGGLTEAFEVTLTPADQMTAFDGEVPSDQGNFWQFGVPGFFVVTTYNEYHSSLDDAANTDEARFETVLVALTQTLREVGKLPPETLAVRPGSSIELATEITRQTSRRLNGTIAATGAQSRAAIENAAITVTLFNDGYDSVLASTQATFVAGTGYTFSLSHDFEDGVAYTVSIDALVDTEASGRSLLRIE